MSLKRIETRLLFINSWVVMCCLFSNTVLLQEIFLVKNDMELLELIKQAVEIIHIGKVFNILFYYFYYQNNLVLGGAKGCQ